MNKFNNLRLSIIVNVLALVFFISPFYPNGCKEAQPAPADSVMPDSICSSSSADTLLIARNDSIASNGEADSLNQILNTKTVNQNPDGNRLVEGLNRVLWGDRQTITGFSCVVFGMLSYVTQYGIITAFIFLLICLMLKNTYEKRKSIIIAILELISIPLLYFTDFDIFVIKAVPNEKLWGFWICLALMAILFLIDIILIVNKERKK